MSSFVTFFYLFKVFGELLIFNHKPNCYVLKLKIGKIFRHENNIFQQKDGVVVGSCLDPMYAGMFVVELEQDLIPKLSRYMTPSTRQIDDTVMFIKLNCISKVINVLDNFYEPLKFTYKSEHSGQIFFLQVFIIRNNRV